MTQTNSDVSVDDVMAMLAGELLPSDIHARRAEKKRLQKVGAIQRRIEGELEAFSTGKLLALRRQFYVYGRHVYRDNNGDYLYGDPERERGEPSTEDAYNEQAAYRYAVYAVLNRRPHVPSKTEGETARRTAATAHHGPKKKGGSRKTIRERKEREQKLRSEAAGRRWERKRERRGWW